MSDDPSRLLDTLVASTLVYHTARATFAGPAGAPEPYTVLHAAADAIAAAGWPVGEVLLALMATTTVRPDELDAENALDWATWDEVQTCLARTLLAREIWRSYSGLEAEDERRAASCDLET